MSYKKLWLPEALVFVFIALLSFVFFWDSRLDLFFANIFYTPGNPAGAWSHQDDPVWKFFYHGAPVMTGVLMLSCLFVLIGSHFHDKLKAQRIYAIFIFLAVALGPGLLINTIFKPYWGRPRPRQVQELGGKYEYQSFWQKGVSGQGMSFPCGHCSVGFVFGTFYWIYRRKNPALAYGGLATSIVLGTGMGIGRIAAGGHFMSDVIWAALMTWVPAWWLYYFGLKIPQREDGLQSKTNGWLQTKMNTKWFAPVIYGFLGLATVTALLLASPFYQSFDKKILWATPNLNATLTLDKADVDIDYSFDQIEAIVINGYAKGFGFPKSQVDVLESFENEQIKYMLVRRGFFSDYESVFKIVINPSLIQNLQIYVADKGSMSIDSKVLPNFAVKQEPLSFHLMKTGTN